MPFPLSVTIISLNEEQNIARAIQSVAWADDVLVVDSGSTDRTVEIARGLGARVVTRPWPGYGPQKNFAQAEARHDWVLNIDADESVPPELARELQAAISGSPKHAGFEMPRKTFYLGRWIRHGGWYPNYLVRLADRRKARWSEPDVHEQLVVDGSVGRLEHPLHHDAFPSIREQVLTNLRYAQLGATVLERAGRRPSRSKLLLKPVGKFVETFVLKRGFLDGMPGFIISINAAHSMFMKYAFLIEPGLRKKP
ncbi:MAG TPA: glycosyltransferase family 2 protein [Bdellovibrionota bacterium]|nr:glycosyltransferase family 2 protein [Bdellovibrionota bacterium]